jgi:hypothetical protein
MNEVQTCQTETGKSPSRGILMDSKQAKALISFNEGRMEFEGSEEFVEKQLAAFADLIKQSLRETRVQAPPSKTSSNNAPQSEVTPDTRSGLEEYAHVFARSAGGKIQILRDVPGNSTSQKTVNVARLLVLANTLSGKPVTTFKEIRQVCEAHGTLDTSNFSETIKNQKADFLFDGSGKSQTVALTVPGRKAAERLAADLNK